MLPAGSTGMAWTTGEIFAPATNRPAKISSATVAPTTISSLPIRRRSSSAISPPMRAEADTAVRKPMATQNSRSDRHQPVIRSVAITAVAQPDRMLATAVAMAAPGLARGERGLPTATGLARGR
jgi:hypothetical protein